MSVRYSVPDWLQLHRRTLHEVAAWRRFHATDPTPVRHLGMTNEPTMQWHDLDDDGGVLEVDERLTPGAPALELHVRLTPGETQALWATDDGALLRWVRPGQA